MQENKMSLTSASLLWFGAAISIAEILTGAFLAPLGLGMGIVAILAGHAIGCVLFYLVGLIGARSRTGAMQSVGISFGRYGSVFFSILNVLQLVGWTAVMIYSGADALGTAAQRYLSFSGNWLWCLVIGAFVLVWILAGLRHVGKLNLVAVGALLVLCVVLGIIVFRGGTPTPLAQKMSFGLALELSIAMPISWLPLISDYTKDTDKPRRFTLVSTASYFIASSAMYAIGLGAAVFFGTSDIVQILLGAGLGIAAIVIVILSTVTTAFLDVYSAGQSMGNIHSRLGGKGMAVLVCVLGTLLAIIFPVTQYENFLYLIGSVFVPMAAVMIADYFLNRNTTASSRLNIANAAVWAVGFAAYRILLGVDTFLGSTIPVVLLTMLLCVAAHQIKKAVRKHV